jgi:hypothetical protein
MEPETLNLKPTSTTKADRSEPEPRWSILYSIVLGELALLILLFYLFTKAFE